jgi:phytoene dehydrogenase-like protein
MSTTKPIVIIGAGLAGLNCACQLAAKGMNYLLLEKAERVGGRVITDTVDGFRLDRGFQVFQTAYPEAQAALDYARLDLRPLEPGALIRKQGKWIRMSDPLRRPTQALATLFNSVGTFTDRLRLLKLQRDCFRGPVEAMLEQPNDCSTLELLQGRYKFSADFIDSFLRPWLSGIFLEEQLETSANYFRFVFRMLASGNISYPAAGIQAIPQQLAARLEPSHVRLSTGVQSIREKTVLLASGETIGSAAVVLATDRAAARQLLGMAGDDQDYSGTRCVYFQAHQPPLTERTLLLNGEEAGPVNHVMVLSNISSQLAPAGQALISVSLVGKRAMEPYDSELVQSQLRNWFGEQVQAWRELANYFIPQALPRQPAGFAMRPRAVEGAAGLVVCGDHCESSSVHGALKSGRHAAEAVVGQVGKAVAFVLTSCA